ncbi:hypothetical protein scyTo_0020907, partial [Scyliorhinus torazame]|nr:hypothetical protein [Scyliorhinus torazame]
MILKHTRGVFEATKLCLSLIDVLRLSGHVASCRLCCRRSAAPPVTRRKTHEQELSANLQLSKIINSIIQRQCSSENAAPTQQRQLDTYNQWRLELNLHQHRVRPIHR